MTTDCMDDERARVAQLDQLQTEVRRREDQFLVGTCDWDNEGNRVDYKELNEYAIAEWAQGLLERQKAAMLAVVESAMSEADGR